jgi:hypothetical protein
MATRQFNHAINNHWFVAWRNIMERLGSVYNSLITLYVRKLSTYLDF